MKNEKAGRGVSQVQLKSLAMKRIHLFATLFNGSGHSWSESGCSSSQPGLGPTGNSRPSIISTLCFCFCSVQLQENGLDAVWLCLSIILDLIARLFSRRENVSKVAQTWD